MRIVVKAPNGCVPGGGGGTSEDGRQLIRGMLPSWADVEVYGDNGEHIPMSLIKSIRLDMTESCEPLVAIVEMYVESVDIECEGVTVPG